MLARRAQVHGYVGNKSAVFPMQTLGLEVDFVNSVQARIPAPRVCLRACLLGARGRGPPRACAARVPALPALPLQAPAQFTPPCVRVCVCVCCSFQTTRATRPFRYSRPFNALAFDVGVRACVCACVRVCVHACAASGDGRARNCHCIFFSEELSLSAIVLIANILYASSMTVYMYVCIYVCMYVCMHVCM